MTTSHESRTRHSTASQLPLTENVREDGLRTRGKLSGDAVLFNALIHSLPDSIALLSIHVSPQRLQFLCRIPLPCSSIVHLY